ncbi:MAG: carboxypeptidase-like regulatory domain-containing protein, partial [Bacteroidota bacterium]
MKYACKKTGLFLACLFLTALTWAQTKRINGKVLSEEDNKPMVGVSVSVKGNSAGTQTGASGEFSIDAADGNLLVLTYTGYLPQEVKVDKATNLSLTMKTDASRLGEVVVVGYGTQRRKEFAGSSTTVNPLTTKFTPS